MSKIRSCIGIADDERGRRLELSEYGRLLIEKMCEVYYLAHLSHFKYCLPDRQEWGEEGHMVAAEDALMEAKHLLTGFQRGASQDEGRGLYDPEVPEVARVADKIRRDLYWDLRVTEEQREVLEAAARLYCGVSMGDFQELMKLEIKPKDGYAVTDEAVAEAQKVLERAGNELRAWRRLRGEEGAVPADVVRAREILHTVAKLYVEQPSAAISDESPEMGGDDTPGLGM